MRYIIQLFENIIQFNSLVNIVDILSRPVNILFLICGVPISYSALFSQLLTGHAIADLLTSIAYFSIPISLLTFIRKRKDIDFKWLLLCFVLFITLCGITHLMHIFQYLLPINIALTIDEIARVLTAIVSIGTAILLWRTIPKALQIPTPTELERANNEITYLAHHDVLTGLTNRTYFNNRMEKAIAKASESQNKLAIIFIDLDRFKVINDTFGHDFGDLLLKTVSERLVENIRKQDVASRQGGDEFILLLEDISYEEVENISRNILKAISVPFFLNGNEIYCTPSIGISFYPDDGMDAQTLIKCADLAMYKAKEKGKNNYQFFTDEMSGEISSRLKLENQLRKAIEENQFTLHYQPLLDLQSNKIIAMEALIRWHHPQKGLVSPAEFITLAEETGLIVPMGEWVINEACRQAKVWRDQGLNLSVSVNLSNRQFLTEDIVGMVKNVLNLYNLPANYLTLEITESLAISNMHDTITKLKELKDFGVKISLDDFGKGYSSLSYLSTLPIQQVKIDKSFIQEIHDKTKKEIVHSINNIAHSLGIKVVAEGIETAEQLEIIRSFHLDFAQGYYISKPTLPEEIDMFGEFLVERITLETEV